MLVISVFPVVMVIVGASLGYPGELGFFRALAGGLAVPMHSDMNGVWVALLVLLSCLSFAATGLIWANRGRASSSVPLHRKLQQRYERLGAQDEIPLGQLGEGDDVTGGVEEEEEGQGQGQGQGVTGETPWYRRNLVSQIFFMWMNGLVRTGAQRLLEMADCKPLKPSDTCQEAAEVFTRNMERERERLRLKSASSVSGLDDGAGAGDTEDTLLPAVAAAGNSDRTIQDPNLQPSVKWVFVRTYGPMYVMVPGLFRLLKSVFMLLSSVYFLPLLLGYISSKEQGDLDYLYGLELVMAQGVAIFLQAVFHHQYFFHSHRQGLQMRGAYLTTVYRKILTMKNTRLPVGEIVNMTSNDSSRIIEFSMQSHHVWATVVEVFVLSFFLFWRLGVSCLPGIVVIFLFFGFQGLAGRIIAQLRKSTLLAVDARVRLMSEVLTSIKLVKLYAWEDAFVKAVAASRAEELRQLRRVAVWKVVNMLMGTSVPIIASVTSFITYFMLGNTLTSTDVFAALTLFNQLRTPMNGFPKGVKTCAEILVALDRLQGILAMPDLVHAPSTHPGGLAVELVRASFTWGEEESTPILKDISLRLGPGQLIAVVGSVGSGKSSLLMGIMGEMSKGSGTLEVHGTLAFSPQQAWVINATLRDNILFGAPYDATKYRTVVQACALEHDILQLPGGDLTEIGERGVNLSGGQKQRVALARAVYSGSSIYLLDDPLGAVDTHVGQVLFDKCIRGVLRDKAVILVTHHLQHLQKVDHILVMKNGSVAEEGSFQDLLAQKGEFAALVAAHTNLDGPSAEYPEAEASAAVSAAPTTEGGSNPDQTETASSPSAPLSLAQTPLATSTEGNAGSPDGDGTKPTDNNKFFGTMVKEDRGTGAVPFRVYKRYCVEGGGLLLSGGIIFMYALTQAMRVATDFWLSSWVIEDGSAGNETNFVLKEETAHLFIGVYVGLAGLAVLLLLSTSLTFYRAALTASTRIHNAVFKAVLDAPISFLDTTPVGRVINRFANDVDQMDDSLTDTLDQTFYFGMQVLGTIILVACIFPYFLIVLVPLLYAYHRIQNFFRPTARELKRLDSITRSPLYAHLSSTLQGLPTIRAYGAQERFQEKNREFIDLSSGVTFTLWGANRWLGFRLDMLALIVVISAALFSVFAPISSATAGLVMAYVLQLTGQFQWWIRQTVEMENKMTSVERLLHYIDNLEPEEGQNKAAVDARVVPPPDWPWNGTIEFDDYSMQYRPGLPVVLKHLRLHIRGREKVGVVGRTGAGKSSLAAALFRMADLLTGRIVIDGLDTSMMSLRDLRSRLAIIPQDPVLFIGTVRSNLTPDGSVEDERIWQVLRQIGFAQTVESLPGELGFKIAENGENLSVGQRQLLCVARALLRGSRVILMDEATASVDLETDDLIQKAIREGFRDCTVITIAHRINTIIGSDHVLVMDQGEVAEYDTPAALLARPDSLFSKLVDQTGRANAEALRAEALKIQAARAIS